MRQSGSDTPPRVILAQFRHGAEAGYFAEELAQRLDCGVELDATDHCDGHAVWNTAFALSVDADKAALARETLASVMRETADRRQPDDGDEPDEELLEPQFDNALFSEAEPPALWPWVAAAVAASGCVVVGIYAVQPHWLFPAERRLAAQSHALGGTTWEQPLGRGMRRLTFDAAGQSARVDIDEDGDGHAEKSWTAAWSE